MIIKFDFDQPLDGLCASELLQILDDIETRIRLEESRKPPANCPDAKWFYQSKGILLRKIQKFRHKVRTQLNVITASADARVEQPKQEQPQTVSSTEPKKERVVYQAPIPENYLLAEAFMIVAQKALPPNHYRRLFALAVDRRNVQSGKPATLLLYKD